METRDIALIKALSNGAGGASYTLPIASSTQLGGVQPVTKTDAMTQEVGVDEAGALWTAAGGSGGAGESFEWKRIGLLSVSEEVSQLQLTLDENGKSFAFREIALFASTDFNRGGSSTTTNGGYTVLLKLDNGKTKKFFTFGYASHGRTIFFQSVGGWHVMSTYTESNVTGLITSGSQNFYPTYNMNFNSNNQKNVKIVGITITPSVDTETFGSGSVEVFGR